MGSPWKLALVVFVAAFALYANTLGHGFVWDDRDLIVDNPRVSTLDGPTVRAMFQENFWKNVQQSGGYYRPVTTLSYHLDHRFYGIDPAGYHATNVLLHAAASTLAFWFVFVLFGHAALALVTALLFAAHPIHTESVAWVSGALISRHAGDARPLVLYAAARRRGLARLLPLSWRLAVAAVRNPREPVAGGGAPRLARSPHGWHRAAPTGRCSRGLRARSRSRCRSSS
jgi:hypothetical protein